MGDGAAGQERLEPEAPVDLAHIDSDSLPSEEEEEETPGGEEEPKDKEDDKGNNEKEEPEVI